jgi:ubiquinone/menaquinone biosynthesis C-methylase UbiE
METFDRKEHWEKIYQTKELEEVSWYQKTPEPSLSLMKELGIPTSAKIIDIGGGDSYFVDHLLEIGYKDITVLDISSTALERAKKRLGDKAAQVTWIQSDVTEFKPEERYDLWHDRAAFHFLTSEPEIEIYLSIVQKSLKQNSVFMVGTFSDQGPTKCSGIEIKQYTEISMADRLYPFFEKVKCVTVDHHTPSGSVQNFLFCSFRKWDTIGSHAL